MATQPTKSSVLLTLFTLLIAGAAYLVFSRNANHSERAGHTTQAPDAALAATTVPPLAVREVLDEDAKILQDVFPGYVLPLERARLTQRLISAVEQNDEREVERLLDQGAEVNWTGAGSQGRSDTRSPLFKAIRRGYPKIVETLLRRGARAGGATPGEIIQSRNQWNQTPLYFAVRCGNREIVDLLLDYGASISAANFSGKTAIVGAVEDGDPEMFAQLLARGAVCDFQLQLSQDRLSPANVICEHSAEYCIPPFDDQCDRVLAGILGLARLSGNAKLIAAINEQFQTLPDYGPALQAEYAVKCGDTETLRKLIADGYDPTRYKPKSTLEPNLLGWAEKFGHAEMVALLAEAGVKRRSTTPSKTVIQLAVESGSVEQLKQLLGQGARLDLLEVGVQNQWGQMTQASPLRLAVRAQQEEMVDFLLQRPEARAEWLNDPDLLLDALPLFGKSERPFSVDICKSLLEADAKFESVPRDVANPHRQPLLRAASAGWADVYAMLVERVPDQENNNAALQAAALGGHTEFCRHVIAQGAQPNSRELTGVKTPLEAAMVNRNRELFGVLVDAGARKIYPAQKDVSGGNHWQEYGHPLYCSALIGDAQFCELIVQQFPPVSCWQALQYEPYEYDNDICYFNKGNTPLFAPVYGDHAEAMKVLLAYGLQEDENGRPPLDIIARNQHGATALHEAVNYGAARCVQLLLAAGADPTIHRANTWRGRGDTVLHLATHWPDAAHSSELEQTRPNASAIFPMLVAAHLKRNNPNWLNPRNAKGLTPLHSHARAANTENCQTLISLGADVNAKTDDGGTPLLSAVIGDQLPTASPARVRRQRDELCIKLVEAGATFDQPIGPNVTSCYTLAFNRGLFGFCDRLREKGVSPDIAQNAGDYLSAAVRFKRADIVERLVSAGADVNALDSQQRPALFAAVVERDVNLCRRLLELGADSNIAGSDGRTALFRVFSRYDNQRKEFRTRNSHETQQKSLELLRLLLDAGADPLATNAKGDPVLRVYSNMPAEFRELIEAKSESVRVLN